MQKKWSNANGRTKTWKRMGEGKQGSANELWPLALTKKLMFSTIMWKMQRENQNQNTEEGCSKQMAGAEGLKEGAHQRSLWNGALHSKPATGDQNCNSTREGQGGAEQGEFRYWGTAFTWMGQAGVEKGEFRYWLRNSVHLDGASRCRTGWVQILGNSVHLDGSSKCRTRWVQADTEEQCSILK